MTTQVDTALALKEWAALIDVLARGDQTIVLRKGGIREKAFLVEGYSFYLLPTFEHQDMGLLKLEFRDGIAQSLIGQQDETGLVVRAHADLIDFWEIDDQRQVQALAPFHIYTDEFVEKRFSWRPKQPLTVMLLRTYRLAEPWRTGLPPGAGGCRSWLEIDAAAAPRLSSPAIDDRVFADLSARLRALFV